MRVDCDGNVEWTTDKRLSLRGSHDSTITIRTATWMPMQDGGHCFVEVSGNLAKFFQGHNLFGTNNLPGLVFDFMRWLAINHAGMVAPSVEDIQAWQTGEYQLTRVDVTDSFKLRTRGDVLTWIRAAEQTAHLTHRGRGRLTKGGTLYFGKESRRWSPAVRERPGDRGEREGPTCPGIPPTRSRLGRQRAPCRDGDSQHGIEAPRAGNGNRVVTGRWCTLRRSCDAPRHARGHDHDDEPHPCR